jgi:hypothetical protein
MTIQTHLQTIAARAEKVTPGPWIGPDFDGWIEAKGHGFVVHAEASTDPENESDKVRYKRPDDAEFIAHARTDIPKLVKALEYCVWCRNAGVKIDLKRIESILSTDAAETPRV